MEIITRLNLEKNLIKNENKSIFFGPKSYPGHFLYDPKSYSELQLEKTFLRNSFDFLRREFSVEELSPSSFSNNYVKFAYLFNFYTLFLKRVSNKSISLPLYEFETDSNEEKYINICWRSHYFQTGGIDLPIVMSKRHYFLRRNIIYFLALFFVTADCNLKYIDTTVKEFDKEKKVLKMRAYIARHDGLVKEISFFNLKYYLENKNFFYSL